jgi:phosphate transport system substrate-binding protein
MDFVAVVDQAIALLRQRGCVTYRTPGITRSTAMPQRGLSPRRPHVLRTTIVVGIVMLGIMVTATAQVTVDPALSSYQRVSGVSGNLTSMGSDTLNNLMTLWAEGFRAVYPNVNIQIEGKGSSSAPPALIEGTAQLGPMSRAMKPSEEDAFEKRYGYKPTAIPVAIDAIAIFVHKDNPLTGLTLAQVDGIFSSTYKRGGKPMQTWGDLGLTGAWAPRPLSLYGRNSASGSYGFFKEYALRSGDFRATVQELPGSSSVVYGVTHDLAGMGYAGIGSKTSGVKAVALGEAGGGTLQEPSLEHCLSGTYPLARFLYIYVHKKPAESLETLVHEFLRFVTTKEGQTIVVKDGYYPLPASVAADTLARLK